MMKIVLTTHGGLAAGLRRQPKIVDTKTLPMGAAAELERLVAAAQATRAPEKSEQDRARDAMTYTISVENGDRSAVLRQSDSSMSPAFSKLLGWLEKH